MPNISDLYASIPGLKADYKIDWREDAKADWKVDWDLVPGGAPAVAPLNTVAPMVSGTPQEGMTLTASAGTWTGNPAPTYTYQWMSNGSAVSGAVSDTYVLQASDVGFMVSCEVTATNSAGVLAVTSAEVGPIDPLP